MAIDNILYEEPLLLNVEVTNTSSNLYTLYKDVLLLNINITHTGSITNVLYDIEAMQHFKLLAGNSEISFTF